MPPMTDWRILLIDDEPDILAMVGMALTDVEYTVKTAGDGAAGWVVCNEFQPHIVITDIRMPHKDGLQLLSDIKASHAGMEVIVATAFGEMASAVRALQLGASDYITKPIAADALMVAVERAKQHILTRRKLQKDQISLLHKDKMMSLGRLAASVAHEINNPLAGVLNYVRLMHRMLDDQGPTPGQCIRFKSYLDTIEKEVDRCSRIVTNLLTFSRKSGSVRTTVDISDVIKRCLDLCRHRLDLGQIVVESRTDGPSAMVMGDPNQLQQCLINLIFNAAEAMPGGGRLVLKRASDGTGHSMVITIADTGSGISRDDLPHIFEPFFTTKQEGQGTGLGLATTYGIIENHHGTITVESRVGHGTTFTIKLPIDGRG